MRKDIVLGAILMVFIVFIINVLVQNFEAPSTQVVDPVVEEGQGETEEEQMARWDRGEFTEEEIAEIRNEEKREDEMSAELLENQ